MWSSLYGELENQDETKNKVNRQKQASKQTHKKLFGREKALREFMGKQTAAGQSWEVMLPTEDREAGTKEAAGEF